MADPTPQPACVKFVASLEAYYGETYPDPVKAALYRRYKTWSQRALRILYELVIQTRTRQYKTAPDLALIQPLEGEAHDQLEVALIPQASTLLPAPDERISDEERAQVVQLLQGLANKLSRRNS